jgi:hypothetical protein
MDKESEFTYLIGEYGMEDWPTNAVLEFGYNKGVVDGLEKYQKRSEGKKEAPVVEEPTEVDKPITLPFKRDIEAEKRSIEDAITCFNEQMDEVIALRKMVNKTRDNSSLLNVDKDYLENNIKTSLMGAFDFMEQQGPSVEKIDDNPHHDVYYCGSSGIFDLEAGYIYDVNKSKWVPDYISIKYNIADFSTVL